MSSAGPFHRRPRRGAFTLLELLIATAAFAIVLAAVNSVFYSALRLRNRSTEAFDDDVAVQHTLSLLRRDIAGLVPPGGTLFGPFQTTPSFGSSTSGSSSSSGTGPSGGLSSRASAGSMALLAAASQPGRSSPEFYTTTGAIDETSPWSELQKVAYYLTPATNASTGNDLIRSVTRNLLPSFQDQPVVTPLLTGVQSIFFQYHDGSQWMDSWDSTSTTTARLPAAVRVQIVRSVADRQATVRPPIEIVVPVTVYGGTNSTTATGTTGGGP